MNDILNNIDLYLKKVNFHNAEVLISTIEGVTLVHSFNSAEDMDNLSSLASAMCGFSKKAINVYDGSEFKDPIIEIDASNSHYLITPLLDAFILIIKVNTEADSRLLIQESKAAIEEVCNILWQSYASGLPVAYQDFIDTSKIKQPLLQ